MVDQSFLNFLVNPFIIHYSNSNSLLRKFEMGGKVENFGNAEYYSYYYFL